MDQADQDRRRSDQPGQVLAGLAALVSLALDGAQAKAATHEGGEVDPAHQDLASGFTVAEIESVVRLHSLDGLGFDQGDVAGVRAVEVAVAFEASTSMGDRGWNFGRQVTALGGQEDSFHLTSLLAHTT